MRYICEMLTEVSRSFRKLKTSENVGKRPKNIAFPFFLYF